MKHIGNLTVTTTGDREIVLTRTFDAPRHLVFEAMTRPELVKRWLAGPPGWQMTVCEIDLRVGGRYRYAWRMESGAEMGMGGEFREIAAPERIVQTEVFDQAWYPGEAIGTLLLKERAGKTELELRVRYESAEALQAVLKTPMDEGVAASYDRLAELLAQPQAVQA
jgi:uncharacterized protein YndB with AHSA1/START domain